MFQPTDSMKTESPNTIQFLSNEQRYRSNHSSVQVHFLSLTRIIASCNFVENHGKKGKREDKINPRTDSEGAERD